jgi:hypothetical protein
MDGLASIIERLERQRAGIDKALAALRDVDGTETSEATPEAPATRKRGMTPEGKKRLITALKKRWALKKAESEAAEGLPVNRRSEGQKRRYAEKNAAAPVAAKKATRKGAISEEGRLRLAEAMKRRWAVKRAAAKKGRRKMA